MVINYSYECDTQNLVHVFVLCREILVLSWFRWSCYLWWWGT